VVTDRVDSRKREAELVRQLCNGSEDAVEEMVGIYKGAVCRYVIHIVKSTEDAEDVAQETFMQVYRRIRTFRGDSGLQTWIFAIAGRIAMRTVRRRRLMSALWVWREGDVSDDVSDSSPDALQQAEESQLRGRLATAIGALSEKHRIVLHYSREGYSYEEMAKEIGIDVGTVRSRLSRARAALLDKMRGVLQ